MDEEPGTPGPATGGLRIPPIMLKVLVAVAAGTATYAIANLIDESQQELWQIVLAVGIGGAALIGQYLDDFGQRLASVEVGKQLTRRDQRDALTVQHHEMTELVKRGFRRVSEVTELLGSLDASGMPSDEISRLIRSATQLGSQSRGIVREFAHSEITRVASMMTALASWGTADWEGENNELLIALTRCVCEGI
ncbi:hypothetical protein ABZT17_02740 [Streptomyces sp. NPDC005648]|uniref:hypothetical protein n=1 Tax=Streptomyces sp. NPDC005648 TaxID=3157044 RepID=UPI0033A808E6